MAYTHQDIVSLLESIRAAIALFEFHADAAAGTYSLVGANSLFDEVAERPVETCIGLPPKAFLPGQIERQIAASLHYCRVMQCPREVGLIVYRQGKSRAWRLLVVPVDIEEPGAPQLIVGMVDISEDKFLERSDDAARGRFLALVESAYDGLVRIDGGQLIRQINKQARELFGVAEETAVGADISVLLPQGGWEQDAGYRQLLRSEMHGVRSHLRMELSGRRHDGSEFPLEATFARYDDGPSADILIFVRDLSEQAKLIEHLKQVATHDPLTGIFNRRHGAASLHSEIHRSLRYGHALTVAMIDIDHFKDINDTFGHACGDLVLNSTVTTISGTLRNTDTICRWGGEEFLVLLPNTGSDEAMIWAERAREAVASHAIIGHGEEAIQITASFGVASLNHAGATQEELLTRVDAALYRAKESGRNRVELG